MIMVRATAPPGQPGRNGHTRTRFVQGALLPVDGGRIAV